MTSNLRVYGIKISPGKENVTFKIKIKTKKENEKEIITSAVAAVVAAAPVYKRTSKLLVSGIIQS